MQKRRRRVSLANLQMSKRGRLGFRGKLIDFAMANKNFPNDRADGPRLARGTGDGQKPALRCVAIILGNGIR